jgi:hypothetical protein
VNDTKLSLIKYYFSELDYYCPTIDLRRLTAYTDKEKSRENVILEGLIRWEEDTHRLDLLRTVARLSMSWIEMLSNLEFEHFLEEVRRLCKKNDQFELLIPLKLNLKRPNMPPDLKLKLRDILNATEILQTYGKIYERILECFAVRLLEIVAGCYWNSNVPTNLPPLSKAFRKVVNKLLLIKWKKYPYLSILYPKFKKAMQNILFSDFKEVNACFFSPTYSSEFPPITLFDAFRTFNKRSAHLIQLRFERILNKLSKAPKLRNEEEFKEFADKNKFSYLSPDDFSQVYIKYGECGQILTHLTNRPWLISLVFAPLEVIRRNTLAGDVNKRCHELCNQKKLSEFYDLVLLRDRIWGAALLNFHYYPIKRELHIKHHKMLTRREADNVFSSVQFTILKYDMLSGTYQPLPGFLQLVGGVKVKLVY